MRINQKLILGFTSIIVLMAAIGILSNYISQKALRARIENESVSMATEMIAHVDRAIYMRILQVNVYAQDLSLEPTLLKSNQEFENLDNIQEYINKKEQAWTSDNDSQIDSFMNGLINNDSSVEIRNRFELKDFYKNHYGYNIYGEVFVTNKYGANIAQTGKTSDYFQADELWWQQAKLNGMFVGDVGYDQSSRIYSIAIATRIQNGDGEFLGVLKAVLDISESIHILKEVAEEHGDYEYKLLTRDSRIIYSTKEFVALEYMPVELKTLFEAKKKNLHVSTHFVAADKETGETEELYSHIHSQGIKSYKGLGWIIVVEHKIEEIFAPIIKLRNWMLFITLLVTIISIAISAIICRSISIPIGKLTKATVEIGKGNFNKPILSYSNDEIGMLAENFNTMVLKLKMITISRDNLSKEIEKRTQVEKKLKLVQLEMEKRLNLLEQSQDATLSMMEDVERENIKRKQAEENIKNSKKFLQRIIDLLPVRVFWKDKNLRYLGCNEVFARDAGKNGSKELVGKDDFQMNWKDQAEIYRNDDQYIIKSGKSKHNYQEPQMTPKGDTIWLNTNKIPLTDFQGNIIGVLGTYEDITERKQLEQERAQMQSQLRQTQKMESIGTLAGGIAHDFNNILGALIGYATLAKDDISEGTLTHDNLQEVLIAAHRAKGLVKQILTFGRKDAAKLIPLQINFIVQEAINMLRSSIPSTIEFRQNINCNNTIMADETQIHQILLNLGTNATHAMQDNGGTLEINLSDTKVDSVIVTEYGTLTLGSYVKLSIKDTGLGMSKDILDRMFEPFYTTKEVGKGTGLGLSVVHGIVENHNGTIVADSKPGKGTTFTIYFPAVEDLAIIEAQSQEVAWGQGEQILLIDDEESLVDMATQMLTRIGYNVTGKTNSLEALKAFEQAPDKFDIVITDYTMPNMTGVKLAKKLMGIRPDIPIIMCSGFSKYIDSESVKSIGIRELVMKPVNREEVSQIIRKILDQERATV